MESKAGHFTHFGLAVGNTTEGGSTCLESMQSDLAHYLAVLTPAMAGIACQLATVLKISPSHH